MGVQTICDRCKKVITTDSREHWRVEAEAFQVQGFKVDLCPLCLDGIRCHIGTPPVSEEK